MTLADRQILVDCRRARLLCLVGGARLDRLSSNDSVAASGHLVRTFRLPGIDVAVGSAGPHWQYEPALRGSLCLHQDYAEELLDGASSLELKTTRLAVNAKSVRLGRITSRLLWAIHHELMSVQRSMLVVSDRWLATCCWGTDHQERPKNWRRTLLEVLDGLRYLGVLDTPGQCADLGPVTALLNHFAELAPGRGQCRRCDDGPKHRHFLINIGRGFLGDLEQLAVYEDGEGVRAYDFLSRGTRASSRSLREVGKLGHMMVVPKPIVLGAPSALNVLNPRQQALMVTILREETRLRKSEQTADSAAEGPDTALIPSITGRGWLRCDALADLFPRCGFNGNGVRHGLGYLIASEAGWMARAGYDLSEASDFLSDLATLETELGLRCVLIGREDRKLYSLAEIRHILSDHRLGSALKSVHLRVYAATAYVDHWRSKFGDVSAMEAGSSCSLAIEGLRDAMAHLGVAQKQLAECLTLDASFVSRILCGSRNPPAGFALSARDAIVEFVLSHDWNPAEYGELVERLAARQEGLLETAVGYLKLGWSVVPIAPDTQKPRVRWAKYRSELPTVSSWTRWAASWPDSDLAVVLGHVSGLVALDVNGPDARAELVDRLGIEPIAPRIQGEGESPDRFCLCFEYPPIETPTEATPWHPDLKFRGAGGLLVLPSPSHHVFPSRCWDDRESIAHLPLPPLPASVMQSLLPNADL